MSQPALIVFDLDGTLVDSAPDLHASANAMLSALGRAPLTLAQVIGFIGDGVPKLVERCLRVTGGLPEDGGSAALGHYLEFYTANAAVLTRPYPGVVAQLDRIAAQGIPMAICTNKPESPARALCAALGLTGYFAVITGGDTCPRKKPDPLPLLSTIAALRQTPATCLYVGDSETDHLTAQAADVRFALYSGGYLKAPIDGLGEGAVFADWATVDLPGWRLKAP